MQTEQRLFEIRRALGEPLPIQGVEALAREAMTILGEDLFINPGLECYREAYVCGKLGARLNAHRARLLLEKDFPGLPALFFKHTT